MKLHPQYIFYICLLHMSIDAERMRLYVNMQNFESCGYYGTIQNMLRTYAVGHSIRKYRLNVVWHRL